MKKIIFVFLILIVGFCDAQLLLKKSYLFNSPVTGIVGGNFVKVTKGYDGLYYFLGKAHVGTLYDEDANGVPYLINTDDDAVVVSMDSVLNIVSIYTDGFESGHCCFNWGTSYNDIPKDFCCHSGTTIALTKFDFGTYIADWNDSNEVGYWDMYPEGFVHRLGTTDIKVFGYWTSTSNINYGVISTNLQSNYYSPQWGKTKINIPSTIVTGLYLPNDNFLYGIQTNSDYYIAELDVSDQIVWDMHYSSANNIQLKSFIQLSNGFLLSGTINSSDFFIHKTDFSGNTVWAKTIGTALVETNTCVASKGDKIFITGNEVNNGVLVVLDTLGNFISGKKYIGTKINFICQDDSLNLSTIFLAGESSNNPIAIKADVLGNGGGCNEVNYLPVINQLTLSSVSNTLLTNTIFFQGGAGWWGGVPLSGVSCSNTLLCSQNLAVPDQPSAFDFKVYPSPTNSMINIELPKNLLLTEIELLTPFGEKVFEKINPSETLQIDVSSFAAGIYYLRLKSGSHIVAKKIILSKN